jgi:hypothetical protein
MNKLRLYNIVNMNEKKEQSYKIDDTYFDARMRSLH